MKIQLEDSKAGERLRQGIQIAIGTIHILRQGGSENANFCLFLVLKTS